MLLRRDSIANLSGAAATENRVWARGNCFNRHADHCSGQNALTAAVQGEKDEFIRFYYLTVGHAENFGHFLQCRVHFRFCVLHFVTHIIEHPIEKRIRLLHSNPSQKKIRNFI